MVKLDSKNYHLKIPLAKGEIPYQLEVDNSITDTTINLPTGYLSVTLESKKNVRFLLLLNLFKFGKINLLKSCSCFSRHYCKAADKPASIRRSHCALG
jgi:hypothetical protein